MRSVAELSSLKERKVLLSGGAGHVGAAVGEALAEMGATVAVLDKDKGACERFSNQLNAVRDGCSVAIPCDLSDTKATQEAVQKAIDSMGGLSILIHSAGYLGASGLPGWAVPLQQQTVEAWDAALRVNLTSAFVMVQAAREALEASGHGSVIFLASIYGVVGPDLRLYEGTAMANPAGYGASKGGLLQLMRYLSTVLAPKIRVNAISPGGIWRDQPESFRKQYISRTPLGRMGTEEDLKGAMTFLASDLSAYITGHNLVVDGGWTAW